MFSLGQDECFHYGPLTSGILRLSILQIILSPRILSIFAFKALCND